MFKRQQKMTKGRLMVDEDETVCVLIKKLFDSASLPPPYQTNPSDNVLV